MSPFAALSFLLIVVMPYKVFFEMYILVFNYEY